MKKRRKIVDVLKPPPGKGGRRPGSFQFKTLSEAERVLQRIANMMTDRERSVLEREKAKADFATELTRVRAARNQCQLDGKPVAEWPPEPVFVMPEIRGISTDVGGKVISSINAFIISRRWQDEFVAKATVAAYEQKIRELMIELSEYRQKVAELGARLQMMQQ